MVSRDRDRLAILNLGLFDEVHLFEPKLALRLKADTNFRSYIIRNMDIEFNDFVLDITRRNPPNVVISHFVWTAGILAKLPANILGILDTIDIQHPRAIVAKNNGVAHFDRHAGKQEELRELRKAQVVVAIQNEEKEVLRQLLPNRRVICASHSLAVKPLSSPHDSRSLLFVGSNYDPNIRGIEQFIDEAWPKIKQAVPTAILNICGQVCESLGNYQNSPGIQLHYEVPELVKLYAQAAVVINPSLYGTGLPIKTSEALAYGKCLVCNPSSARGFDKDSFPGIICDYNEMSEHIIPILENLEKRRQIEETTAAYAERHLAPEIVFEELVSMIKKLSENMPSAASKMPATNFIAKLTNYPWRKLFYYYASVVLNRLLDFNTGVKGEKGAILAKHIQLYWQMLACKQNIRRVAIYGAGKHTRWLEWVLRQEDAIEIIAVLDDRANSNTVFFGKPLILPTDFDPSTVDAIILSSDCIQDKLAGRCRELYGNDIKLINLYEGLPPGPYAK